ncbi:MAG: TlyA family RNA methyltransferase [Nitrospirae bacterium]|nr:TlyA family RNA methyltransferase [Nitrospirota bacterium]
MGEGVKERRLRLDVLLVERGLAETRQKALGVILSGSVYVDGTLTDKAGTLCNESAEISIRYQMPYVSRGGLKLEEAVRHFNLDLTGMTAMDIGASTGGFTDCLLQNGVKKVYAIDVGYGQLHWKLRDDPRVINLEKTHILKFDWAAVTEAIDIVTIDVSFISLTRILTSVWEHLSPPSLIVALVKPQFEVGKGEVGKGGIVRDTAKILSAVNKVIQFAEGIGFRIRGSAPSPIPGQKGNREYLVVMEK